MKKLLAVIFLFVCTVAFCVWVHMTEKNIWKIIALFGVAVAWSVSLVFGYRRRGRIK